MLESILLGHYALLSALFSFELHSGLIMSLFLSLLADICKYSGFSLQLRLQAAHWPPCMPFFYFAGIRSEECGLRGSSMYWLGGRDAVV